MNIGERIELSATPVKRLHVLNDIQYQQLQR